MGEAKRRAAAAAALEISQAEARRISAGWFNDWREEQGYKDRLLRDAPNYFDIARLRSPDDPEFVERLSQLTLFQKDETAVAVLLAEMELTSEERKFIGGVFVGIMPTNKLNAQKRETPKGDTVLILHAGLLQTLQFISMYLPVQIKGDLSTSTFPDTDLLLLTYLCAIGQLWIPDLINLHCEAEALALLPETSWKRVDMLMKTALGFILGHEIFHLMDGQLYSGITSRDHALELKADRYGLDHAARMFWKTLAADPRLSRELASYALLGPYVALAAEALAANPNSKTHPPSPLRLNKINEGLLGAFTKASPHVELPEDLKDLLQRVGQAGSEFVTRHLDYRKILYDMDCRMMHATLPVSVSSLYRIPLSTLSNNTISVTSGAPPPSLEKFRADLDREHDKMFPPQPEA